MQNISRRNVLILLFDALAAGPDGAIIRPDLAPNLAKLAKAGAVFQAAYTPASQGSPARASFFTGLDPAAHGLWQNGVVLPSWNMTFPQRLAPLGYHNILVGRRHLAGVANWTTEHCRLDEYAACDWAHGPLHRSRQNAYLAWLQDTQPEIYFKIFPKQANPDDTEIASDMREAVRALPESLSFNTWVGQQLAERIADCSAECPFLGIAGFVVGAGMGAPPSCTSESEQLDDTALRHSDTAAGALFEMLDASGRLEDTVVILTSARGNCEPGSEMSEANLHVPLVLNGPAIDAQTIKGAVSTIDIAPTILDLAAAPIPARMQGASLHGVLSGSCPPRGWSLSRHRSDDALERNWQTALIADGLKLVMRHGDTKGACSANYALFDLKNDPSETTDLAELPAHAASLEAMIDKLIDARCAMEDRTEPRIAKF